MWHPFRGKDNKDSNDDEGVHAGDENTDPDDCDCAICHLRRRLEQADAAIAVDISGGGIDVKQLLGQLIQSVPYPMRPMMVADLFKTMCMTAVCDLVPEEKRSDPDAWAGHTPRELYNAIMETLDEHVPDETMMAELWNDYVVREASETLAGNEQVTFPTEWVEKQKPSE
jgi:hypothetical protein